MGYRMSECPHKAPCVELMLSSQVDQMTLSGCHSTSICVAVFCLLSFPWFHVLHISFL